MAIVFALVNVLGSASKTYPVPNLAGMTADQAQTAITQDGHFKMGETKESYSSSVEQGKVMDQDPRASRQMPEGTTINIVISKGEEPKEQVSVPNLTNKTPKEAQEAWHQGGPDRRRGATRSRTTTSRRAALPSRTWRPAPLRRRAPR